MAENESGVRCKGFKLNTIFPDGWCWFIVDILWRKQMQNTHPLTFVVVHCESSSPSQISCVTWEDDRHISIVSCKDQRGLGIYSAKTSVYAIHMNMIYQYIYIYDISYIHDISMFISLVHTFCDFLVGRVSNEWGKLVPSLNHLGWVSHRWRMPYFQLLGWPMDDGSGRPFKGVGGGWNWIQHGRCMYHYVSPRIFAKRR